MADTIHIPLEKINIKINNGPFQFDIMLDKAFTTEGLPAHSTTFVHYHPAFEVHFVTGGRGILFTATEEFPLQKGDLIVTPPDIFHGFQGDPICYKGCFQFTYAIRDTYDDLFPEIEITDLIKMLTNMNQCKIIHSFDMIPWVKQILEEFNQNQPGCYMKIQGMFTHLLIDLLRAASQNIQQIQPEVQPDSASPIRFPLKTLDESRMRVIDMFFSSNRLLRDQPNLEQLADQLNLSIKQTQRVIQQLYGKSYRQIVTDIQIEVAKHFLAASTLPISDIAELIGFMDRRNFSRRFSQTTGCSPAKYRSMYSIPAYTRTQPIRMPE